VAYTTTSFLVLFLFLFLVHLLRVRNINAIPNNKLPP
jgi:hypothetical protein